MRSVLQVRAIGANTFVEAIRQPIFVVLLLLGVGTIALTPAFSTFTLDDDNKLLIDLGTSTIFMSGLFLAAFTATGVVSREIERRTVLTVVSKPLSRPLFVVGKFLGVLGAVSVAHWIWCLVFLLAVRHRVVMRASDVIDEPVLAFGCGALLASLGASVALNYFRGRVFGSALTACLAVSLPIACLLAFSFDKGWRVQSPTVDLDGQISIALLLLLEAEATLCAVAVAASTRMGQSLTLAACSGAFLLGLTSDYFFGRFAHESWLAQCAYTVIPNFQFQWLADALTQGRPVDATYVFQTTGYTTAYVAAILAIGIAAFQTREVG
ncbi:MAG: ABC transporter permease subunit [Planctomycetota bacterium]